MTRVRRLVWPVVAGAVGIALLVVIWHWLSTFTVATRLPSPAAVFNVLTTTVTQSPVIAAQGGGAGGFLPHIWASIWHTLLAVLIGTVLGVFIGWLFAQVRWIREFVQPPVELLRLIPSLVAVPFFVLWFGIGSAPQLVLIIAYTALVMQVSAYITLRDLPPQFGRFSATLGANSWQRLVGVQLPAAVPALLGSLRVTLQLAWGLTIVAELMGAQIGIGKVMSSAARFLRTDYVMAGVIWISVVAMLTDLIFRLVIRRTTAWSRE